MIDAIDKVVNAISSWLYTPWVPAFLIVAGLYFTARTKFIQFRLFGESIHVVSEKPKDKNSVSSLGALMISTASRVGTGNIVGVSSAICVGGYGAVFWMWITAILGGASAFIESTLAQIYKKRDGDGSSYGGPSYYMEDALHQRWLGVVFAVIIILTYAVGYNALASYNLQSAFAGFSFYKPGVTPYVLGGILAVLFAVCVLGGAKRLTNITGILVPVMGVIYIIVSLIVICINIGNIPSVFANIFRSAFDFKAIFGGFLGSAMMQGIKRGLYSNEAGMGSAPNAAATADVSHPVKQGLVQMLSVFIDTLLICTATALMCLSTGIEPTAELQGAPYVQQTMAAALGSFGVHCRVHVPVCLHDADRQLLLLRGLPQAHPQAPPEQDVYACVPSGGERHRPHRRDGQHGSGVGYRRPLPGADGHHQHPGDHHSRQARAPRAERLHEAAQGGQGSALQGRRHRPEGKDGLLELTSHKKAEQTKSAPPFCVSIRFTSCLDWPLASLRHCVSRKVFFAAYTPPQKTDWIFFAALRCRELCETLDRTERGWALSNLFQS